MNKTGYIVPTHRELRYHGTDIRELRYQGTEISIVLGKPAEAYFLAHY